jgi:hypothetical protein
MEVISGDCRVAKRLTTDWRLWAGLALALMVALAGVIANEYPQVAAIRQLRRSGWEIHREPLRYGGPFAPNRLLRVQSRLPAWIVTEDDDEWVREWFVRVLSAEMNEHPHLGAELPDFQDLQLLQELRELHVRDAGSPDGDWRGLVTLKSLETISIDLEHTLSMAEIRPLQHLPRLRGIHLRVPDVDDEALDALSQMTHLEELTIYSPGVTQRLSPAITLLQSQKHVTLRVGDDQQ